MDDERFRRADRLSYEIIGAAIEVHRLKGPGLLESIYQKCFQRELELKGIPAQREVRVNIEYKGLVFDDYLQADFFIDESLVVELKAVEHILPIHKAQLLTYMKLTGAPLGLLINFNEQMLKNGIHRLVLTESSRSP